MVDPEAERLGARDHRRRRRRAGGRDAAPAARAGCAASSAPSMTSTVGAPFRCVTPSSSSSRQTTRRVDLPQADVRRADGGHRPGEAPAVAVEHRQRPEVDRARVEPRVVRLGERVQVRAAVRVHHALRPAGRAARVVDRDRVVLRLEPVLGLAVRRAGEELLVVAASPQTRTRSTAAPSGTRCASDGSTTSEPRARVLEDVADLVRHQPRVDRDQHARPATGTPKCASSSSVAVRRQERDPVVLARSRAPGARRRAVARARAARPRSAAARRRRPRPRRETPPPSARGTRAASAARGGPRSRWRTLQRPWRSPTPSSRTCSSSAGSPARITLNRPEKRNALSLELMEELIARARVGRRRRRGRGRS